MTGEKDNEPIVLGHLLAELVTEHALDGSLRCLLVQKHGYAVGGESLPKQRFLYRTRVVHGVSQFGDVRIVVIIDPDHYGPRFTVDS